MALLDSFALQRGSRLRHENPATSQFEAWAIYTDRRRRFSTAVWLHQLVGLAGAHRFYVGRKSSGWAQLALGLGSAIGILATMKVWGAGAMVFLVPLAIGAIWNWWDHYELRDMVREHNRTLARRVGLDPTETDRLDDAIG